MTDAERLRLGSDLGFVRGHGPSSQPAVSRGLSLDLESSFPPSPLKSFLEMKKKKKLIRSNQKECRIRATRDGNSFGELSWSQEEKSMNVTGGQVQLKLPRACVFSSAPSFDLYDVFQSQLL